MFFREETNRQICSPGDSLPPLIFSCLIMKGAAKPISIKARCGAKKEGGRRVVTIEKRNDSKEPTILSS